MLLEILAAVIIAYLLGSLNTSVIVSKYFLHDDIRKYGSGNPGTSNMIRQFGFKYGVIVLLGDLLKGLAAALVGKLLCGDTGVYYSAIAVVIGHNWPVYYRFKGGKGVATTFGVLLVIVPWWALGGFALFALVLLITRYFSLASLISLLYIWVVIIITRIMNVELVMTISVIALLVIFRHIDNIKRLRNGTEKKL